jgi:hypothetical protein
MGHPPGSVTVQDAGIDVKLNARTTVVSRFKVYVANSGTVEIRILVLTTKQQQPHKIL